MDIESFILGFCVGFMIATALSVFSLAGGAERDERGEDQR